MKKNSNKFLIGVVASISVAALLGGLSIGALVQIDDVKSKVDDLSEVDEEKVETEAKDFEFQLLHYSDIDGGRNIVDTVQRFAAMQKKFTDEYENTLALSSGDLWIAGPEYNIAGDKHVDGVTTYFGEKPKPGRGHVHWANQLGIKASGLGNHEFDQGTEAVSEIIAPAKGWEGAAFPYIVTNMDFSEDDNLGPLVVPGGQDVESIRGKITDYATVMVGGEKIGLVGAIYPDLDQITSLGGAKMIDTSYATFTEKLQHVAIQLQEDIDALKNMGINKIIALTHFQQFQYEQEIASMLDGVDIIIGGGSNEILLDNTDVPRSSDTGEYESYPVKTTSKTNEPMMLVNTDGDFTYLGRLVVKFDKDGVLIPESYDPGISGAYATTPDTLARLGLTEDDYPKLVHESASSIKDELVQKRGNVFGYTKVYLNGERAFVRTEESNLGNLVIDSKVAYARRFYSSGIMVGIQNGGGIRGPIGSCIYPPGSTSLDELECRPPLEDDTIPVAAQAITELDVQTVLKFNNGITLLSIKASLLKEIFEDGLSRVTEGSTPGPFPQISNLRLEYYIDGTSVVHDEADGPNKGAITTPGDKVKTITIIDTDPSQAGDQSLNIVEDGQVVEANKDTEIKLVAPSWLAAFGKSHDGYWSLGSVPEDKREDLEDLADPSGFSVTLSEKGKEQDALAWYIKTKYGTVASAYDIEDEDRETVDVAAAAPADTRITKLHKTS